MISFIIPAYNEEPLIGETLTAIHRSVAQSLAEPYEIIVTDDASSDDTATVAANNGARVISVARRQISAARNAGAGQARGDLLIFVDADTMVNTAVVRAAVGAMRGGAVGGGAAVRFGGRIPLYARALEKIGTFVNRIFRYAAGCFLFCRREAFEAVGGFDERLFGAEEIALSRALKRQGRFVVLRESVITSGRKLRAYSAIELLKVFANLAIRGWSGVRSRDAMSIWYDDRRDDPDG